VIELDVGSFARYWTSNDLEALEDGVFEIVYSTTTRFDQHGQDFEINPPDALDLTGELLLDQPGS